MLAGFNEKLFVERMDVTKNLDMPFSLSKLLGEYDWQTSNAFLYLIQTIYLSMCKTTKISCKKRHNQWRIMQLNKDTF